EIVAPIVAAMDRWGEPYRLVVTMDHYTPLARRTHEDWPVPLFIYDSRGSDHPCGTGYTETNIKDIVEKRGGFSESGAEFFRRFINRDSTGTHA
ncbi:MAG: phosphoglycerate mutase, partial [Desulfocapsa sp.]